MTEARTSIPGREWWRGAIIYEVYVRSFRDTDADGIGDLRGVVEKLDHIADLGVDAIWLSPFYKSPQKDFGYDVSDFRVVDPTAGSMEDVLAVIEGAHERGLRVLLDFTPGHTSDEHPWFSESRSSRDAPKSDWYVWADKRADGGPPNNWLSSFGGSAWAWEPQRGQYYYHPFLSSQPALNLHNETVLEQVIAQMDFWLDFGVDGFRLDAVQCLSYDPELRSNPPKGREDPKVLVGGGSNNPFADQLHIFDRAAPGTYPILRRLRRFADGRGCVLIGELADVDSSRVAHQYTRSNEMLHAVYDFDLINCEAEVDAVTGMLETRTESFGDGWLVNVFTNHDSRRAVSNLTDFADPQYRRAAAKMLLFMQLTLRGGAVIFQGEELGLTHPKLKAEDILDPWAKAFWPTFEGRDGARTPYPWSSDAPHAGFSEAEETWLPLASEHRGLDAAGQREDPGSVLVFFRDFTRWRRDQPILKSGGMKMWERDHAPLISWHRMIDATSWRFVINFSEEVAFLPVDDAGCVIRAPGCVSDALPHGLELPPFGFAICENKGER